MSEEYGFKRCIEAVKDAVSIADVAAEYTELRLLGEGRYTGRCPAPDHEDRNPSFHVYADSEDPHFHCFSCLVHGDVIDLEEICGRHVETWTAMLALSERYGVELPQRSEKWLRAGGRKQRYRSAQLKVLGDVLKRRLFRTLVLPFIDLIVDDVDRERELERAWADWCLAEDWSHRASDFLYSDPDGAIEALAAVKVETDEILAEAVSEAGGR